MAASAFDIRMQIQDLAALTPSRDPGEIRNVVTDLIGIVAPVLIDKIVEAFRDYDTGSRDSTRDIVDPAVIDQLTQRGFSIGFQLSTPLGGVGAGLSF